MIFVIMLNKEQKSFDEGCRHGKVQMCSTLEEMLEKMLKMNLFNPALDMYTMKQAINVMSKVRGEVKEGKL